MHITSQPIFIYGICYLALLVAEKAAARNNSHRLKTILFQNGSMDKWQLRTIYGLLILGSAILYSLSVAGNIPEQILLPENTSQNWYKLMIYEFVIVYLALKKSIKEDISHSSSPVKNLFPYLSLQVPFMIEYELFFYGILLFGFMQISGPFIAIAFTITLQALFQYSGNKKELISSLFISILVCIICLDMRSVFPAVLTQITASLIFDIRLFHYSQTSKSVTI